jgi:hypothetical protein
MQLATIAPTATLKTLTGEGQQRFHLVLVHLLERDPDYEQFYKERARAGDFLLLDNSAYELGAAVDDTLIHKWARILQPQEIALPDVRMDTEATIARTKAFLSALPADLNHLPCAAVPQGKTWAEWWYCLEQLLTFPQVTTLAIIHEAQYFFADGKHARMPLLDRLSSVRDRAQIHLLGTDDALVEWRLVPRYYPWVRSTDSSKAVMFGFHGIRLGECATVPAYPGRPKDTDFFALQPNPQQIQTMLWNQAVAQSWVRQAWSVSVEPW